MKLLILFTFFLTLSQALASSGDSGGSCAQPILKHASVTNGSGGTEPLFTVTQPTTDQVKAAVSIFSVPITPTAMAVSSTDIALGSSSSDLLLYNSSGVQRGSYSDRWGEIREVSFVAGRTDTVSVAIVAGKPARTGYGHELGVRARTVYFVDNSTSGSPSETISAERTTVSPSGTTAYAIRTNMIATRRACTAGAEILKSKTFPDGYQLIHLAFSPDEGSLAFAALNPTLTVGIVSLAKMESVEFSGVKYPANVSGKVTLTPDGKFVALALADGKIDFYRVSTAQYAASIYHTSIPIQGDATPTLAFYPFSENKTLMATASAFSPRIRLWVVSHGGPPTSNFKIEPLAVLQDEIQSEGFGGIAFLPEKTSPCTLVSAGKNRRVLLWDLPRVLPPYLYSKLTE